MDVLKHLSARQDQVQIGKEELIPNSTRPLDEYHFSRKIPPINVKYHCNAIWPSKILLI